VVKSWSPAEPKSTVAKPVKFDWNDQSTL